MRLVDNPYLRELVTGRLKELSFTDSKFLKDSAKMGMKMQSSQWSRYVNDKPNKISDEQLLWVAIRLGIDINIRFGKPVLIQSHDGITNEIEWKVPPYNEEYCLTRIKELYPHLTNG